MLEKTLESPLDSKEIQPVHSEGDQPWDFFGGNDAEAETPVLWPPHAKSWLIGKDFDAGRDWGQEKKGTTGWEGWMASLTQWTWVWVNSELVMSREAWRAVVHGVSKSRTWLSDWTDWLSWVNRRRWIGISFLCGSKPASHPQNSWTTGPWKEGALVGQVQVSLSLVSSF